jgi:large subunit ribosomal protein L17
MQNVIRSVFLWGKIQLPTARAKEIKRQVDKLMSLASTDSVTTLRLLTSKIGSVITAKSIMKFAAVASKKRATGFTRVVKIGQRRGDGTEIASLELVDYEAPKKLAKVEKDKKEVKVAKDEKAEKPEKAEKVKKVTAKK